MMMKIYGRRSSSNVQKVLWCCAEIGLAHDRIDMGREFGGNKEPTYLAMNPNGVIPTLVEDDGFVLWESNSILRYLAKKYGPPGFYPADARQAAIGEQWMDWQLNSLNTAFSPMFYGLVRQTPEQRDPAAIAKSIADTQHHLAMIDRHLQGSRFVTGDTFTVADIPIGIYVYRWYAFDGLERASLPALARWYADLQQRAAYRDHVMVGLK